MAGINRENDENVKLCNFGGTSQISGLDLALCLATDLHWHPAFCSVPSSLLQGYEVCKWGLIHSIHREAAWLRRNVRNRTAAIVKSTEGPNTENSEVIDPFSWMILAPIFGSINRGRWQTLQQSITSQWPRPNQYYEHCLRLGGFSNCGDKA